MNNYYEKICAGEEVRKNLISLKKALGDEKEKRAFAYHLAGDFSILLDLLEQEDPKVRKNAALILGEMESEEILPILFDAYQKETTLFVRPAYLQAMKKMDCREILPQLKKQLKQVEEEERAAQPDEKKHRLEEKTAILRLLSQYETHKKHRFTGEDYNGTVILLTNRNCREATVKQIPDGKKTMLLGGVKVSEVKLKELLPIRTYQEWLLPVSDFVCEGDTPEKIGEALAKSSLVSLVSSLHSGNQPYYYRIELKSSVEMDKKGAYIRKVSEVFEQQIRQTWTNSMSDYEIEIRLLQKKDRSFLAMLKLYTVEDGRFRYRKESIASSIAPVNAALAVELARPWLKEHAQILDPFCGVGTMLIERNYAVPAKELYGIDIFGEAVEKARINTDITGMQIHYINKDCFEFRHEYLFDEVITDFPQVTKTKSLSQIRQLYLQFFREISTLLQKKAVLVLYTSNPEFVKLGVKENGGYQVKQEFLVNERKNTTVFVIGYEKMDWN